MLSSVVNFSEDTVTALFTKRPKVHCKCPSSNGGLATLKAEKSQKKFNCILKAKRTDSDSATTSLRNTTRMTEIHHIVVNTAR